jgi:hypothetical protein
MKNETEKYSINTIFYSYELDLEHNYWKSDYLGFDNNDPDEYFKSAIRKFAEQFDLNCSGSNEPGGFWFENEKLTDNSVHLLNSYIYELAVQEYEQEKFIY